MSCPICKKDSHERFRPFCSLRCADVDLGKWMTGRYAAPSVSEDEDWDRADELQNDAPKTH